MTYPSSRSRRDSGGIVAGTATRTQEGVHPIEAESYRILAERVDLRRFGPLGREVVARVIHATADVSWAESMVVEEEAVAAGVEALRSGAPVLTDVEMVRHGIVGVEARCYLPGPTSADGVTRSALGMRLAAAEHPRGAVVVVGCAPTALEEILELAAAGNLVPALVVGMPVGFVGAAAAKEALRASGLPTVSNVGERGGSSAAAAAVNAMVRLAR